MNDSLSKSAPRDNAFSSSNGDIDLTLKPEDQIVNRVVTWLANWPTEMSALREYGFFTAWCLTRFAIGLDSVLMKRLINLVSLRLHDE